MYTSSFPISINAHYFNEKKTDACIPIFKVYSRFCCFVVVSHVVYGQCIEMMRKIGAESYMECSALESASIEKGDFITVFIFRY